MDLFTTDRWAEIDALFAEALERPPDERTAFLRAACGDDPALYHAVTTLLESDAAAESALGESATVFAAHLLDASAGPAPGLPPGTRVGPYRIEGELGRGGMGTVYRAARADGTFEKAVALKLVKRGMDTDEVLRRFRYERQILAGLDHPHIARLLDAGATADGRPYLVMELVEGEPITAYADARRLNLEARLVLFEQVCEAVAYAHRHLVVHRDLKPSNILVADRDRGQPHVKLLDFGIARLLDDDAADAPHTRPEQRVLTPEYAAPEQRRGEPATTATDVYALGVVLFELLVGRRPEPPAGRLSTAGTPGAAEVRGTTPERLRRALRGDLDTLVLKALRDDPARRYPTAEALLDDLRRRRVGRPLRARPDSRVYRARKFLARHRWGVGAVAAGMLALIAFSVVLAVEQRQTARERDKAQATADFLEGLFAAADPFAAERLDTLRVHALLDRGTAALDDDLAAQPAVQAHLLGVIGRSYEGLGRYAEAETLLRRALRQTEQIGADALDRADAQVALAGALYVSGTPDAWAEAEALYRDALATRRLRLGGAHPAVATTLNDLALVLVRRGAHDGAEQHFREALALHRQAHPADSVELAITLKNLADLLADRDDYAEAESLLRESVALRRRLFGAGHPSVAVGLQSLAVLFRNLERYAEAEPLVREALAVNEAALGPAHPHVADNLNLLGSVLRGQTRYEEATDALREAVARTRARRGGHHPDVALALNTYAGLLIAQEDYAAAEAALREAVAITREAFGGDHPAVAFNVARLGQALRGRGNHTQALAYYREALSIFESHFGVESLHVALLQGNLGDCLIDLGRYAEAETFLQASSATLNALHDPEHARTRIARDRLARLYDVWRGVEAAQEQREALEVTAR